MFTSFFLLSCTFRGQVVFGFDDDDDEEEEKEGEEEEEEEEDVMRDFSLFDQPSYGVLFFFQDKCRKKWPSKQAVQGQKQK